MKDEYLAAGFFLGMTILFSGPILYLSNGMRGHERNLSYIRKHCTELLVNGWFLVVRSGTASSDHYVESICRGLLARKAMLNLLDMNDKQDNVKIERWLGHSKPDLTPFIITPYWFNIASGRWVPAMGNLEETVRLLVGEDENLENELGKDTEPETSDDDEDDFEKELLNLNVC